MSIAKVLQRKLESIKLQKIEIKCFGSQIIIECLSLSSCEEWADIIKNFAKIRGIIKSIKETKKSIEKNKYSSFKKYYEVYRLYACIN